MVVHRGRKLFANGFTVRHDNAVFHHGRKLFAYSFLSDMAPSCFTSIGNFSSGDFSAPLRFARNDKEGMTPLYSANFFPPPTCHPERQRRISVKAASVEYFHKYQSAGSSLRRLPTRHGSVVFHRGRKLFAGRFLDSARNDREDMAPSCFTSAGNWSHIVSYPAWLRCASSRQETVCV